MATDHVRAGQLDLTTSLIRSAALVQDILAAASGEHGLTAQQAQLMCVVGDEPSSMMRLGALLRIGKSSMTGLVHRAEQAGLVQRAPDPGDGRSTLIMLTEKGRLANTAFRETVGQRIEKIVATLPAEERSALTTALSRIVLTQQAPQTWPPRTKGTPMTTSAPDLPTRSGPRPKATTTNPHVQLEQNAPVELQDRLREHSLSLPGVRPGVSQVSVPGTVAFFLDAPPQQPTLPDMLGGEWGHIHPHSDGSLHLNVPTEFADQLIEAGWAEYHCLVRPGIIPPMVVMLYGPRDEEEFAVCTAIVEEAYLAAGGSPTDQHGRALGLTDA